MNEDLRTIELNLLAVLHRAKELENNGERPMSKNEKFQFGFLTKKYPSKNLETFFKKYSSNDFFMFNVNSGFFDREVRE